MYPSHTPSLSAISLAAGAAAVCLLVSPGSAESPRETAPEQAVYDRDPQHLWNRLHEALFVRVGSDGVIYGRDRFEPLLWPGSRHLLQGPSHELAVKLLNEFLEKDGEKL